MPDKSKTLTCPTCGQRVAHKEAKKEIMPFCNERCKMIDLGKWLGEKYVIGSEVVDSTEIEPNENE